MVTKEFKLPDVGEGIAEGELVSWLVAPGDPVEEDQPVAEVETDKALVEVPSSYDGVVKELHVDEGEVVPVGTVIITFEVPEEGEELGEVAEEVEVEEQPPSAEETGEQTAPSQGDEPETPSGRVFASPSTRRLAREHGIDIGRIEGGGAGGRITESDVRAAIEEAEGREAAGEEEETETAKTAEAGGPRSFEPGGGKSVVARRGSSISTAETAESIEEREPATPHEATEREHTLAAPATRRVAEEEGVDIHEVPAVEQREGEAFVTEEAVREYAEAQRAARKAEAETAEAEAERRIEVSAGEETEAVAEAEAAAAETAEAVSPTPGERIPYRGVRRTIGEQMERSKFTVPHVTHHDDVDATDLVATRERLKEAASERDVRLTYTPLIMKAVTAALQEHPILNSMLDEEHDEIVLREEYNIGVATATDAGLMVPVVDDVDAKGLLDIAEEVNEKGQKARDRRISREEMQGGTFTITNIGTIGGEYATPIINYPETAILAIGAIKERPRVVDGEVVPRETMTLSLAVDHRVIDGADAARFTNTLKEYLRDPTLLLLD